MIKRGQIYVRAQTPSGKWVSADILNLTQESFDALIARFADTNLAGSLRLQTVGEGVDGAEEKPDTFYKPPFDPTRTHHGACDPGWGPRNYRCHPDCKYDLPKTEGTEP